MMRRVRASWCAVAALLLHPSCIQFQVQRSTFDAPVLQRDLDRLVPGTSRLGECLRVLGAPHYVRPQPAGPVLAWAWGDDFSWGLSASYSISELAPSASASFDSADVDVRGVALFFTSDEWVLERVEEGRLRSIVPPAVRPVPLEEL